MAKKNYSTFIPQVIPKQFSTNESCQMVAIYNEDLSDSPRDAVTLIFPGDQAGSSPRRVVPDRVGTRTLVFKTPEYKTTFTNRNTVEVLPILHHPDGDIELKPFTLTIKNAIRSVIELCVSLANSEAVLPALITLMLHCTGEKNNFQDPQFDRILSALVGSRTPGSSISIKNIVLPKKQWRRMDLADLCNEYQLTCTENQANAVKHGRRLPKKMIMKKSKPNQARQLYENLTPLTDCGMTASRSDPALARNCVASSADAHVERIEALKAEAEAVYRVDQDVNPSDPSYLSFKVGQEVFVTDTSSPDLWYGVCGDKYGYFDPNHVTLVKMLRTSTAVLHSDTEVGSEQPGHSMKTTISTDSLQTGSQPIKGSFHLRQRLVRHPDYENTYVAEKHPAEIQGHQHHFQQCLSMSTDTGLDQLDIAPHIDHRHPHRPLPKLPVRATAGEVASPLVKKKVAPPPPPKPSRKWISSSSDSEEMATGVQTGPLPLPPRNTCGLVSQEVQPQPTVAVPVPVSRKDNKPLPPPRHLKRSLVQTFSDPQPSYSASQGTSDHEYEEIDTVRPPNRGRQHCQHRGHAYPAQTWQEEIKQRGHREHADSGWSSGYAVSDNDT